MRIEDSLTPTEDTLADLLVLINYVGLCLPLASLPQAWSWSWSRGGRAAKKEKKHLQSDGPLNCRSSSGPFLVRIAMFLDFFEPHHVCLVDIDPDPQRVSDDKSKHDGGQQSLR